MLVLVLKKNKGVGGGGDLQHKMENLSLLN